MSESPPTARSMPDPYAWETEHAPRISRLHMAIPVIVYLAWLGFLAVMAGQRWFGTLQ